jgi:O-antigen ligase
MQQETTMYRAIPTKATTELRQSSFLRHMLMATFFLGGITLSTGSGGLYIPLVLFPIILVLILLTKHVRLNGLQVPYLFLTFTILLSSVVLSFGSTTSRQLAGLLMLLFGWLALLCGSFINVTTGKALTTGGFVLLSSIVAVFAQAWVNGDVQLSFAYGFLPGNDYALKSEISTIFGGSNFLAAFMLFFLGYSAATRKVPLFVASVLGVYLTMSKSAVGIAVLFIVILAAYTLLGKLFPRLSGKARSTGALAVVVPLLAYYLLDSYNSAVASYDFRALTLTQRTSLWEDGLRMIANKPFFGNGYGSMVDLDGVWSVHNGLLDYWLSYGVFAMVALAVFLFCVLWRLRNEARSLSDSRERAVPVGIILGLVLMLTHSMVEPLLLTAQFLIFIGLIAAGTSTRRSGSSAVLALDQI